MNLPLEKRKIYIFTIHKNVISNYEKVFTRNESETIQHERNINYVTEKMDFHTVC